ncbi:MAG: CDP-glycerol glycerophosphotransferase family protein [Actinomycetia bacterium]|nr:CDP-glycerol glycerophosphotransferase family protein [Actinomycetes bacterium]
MSPEARDAPSISCITVIDDDGSARGFSVAFEECLASLFGQDIGFNERVQLILISVASTAKTISLAEEWASHYPSNIELLKAPGVSVAAARNIGLGVAKGDCIAFVGARDVVAASMFRTGLELFEKYPELGSVAFHVRFRGGTQKFHSSRDAFKANRLTDLDRCFKCPQIDVSSLMFARKAIEGLVFKEDPYPYPYSDIDFIVRSLLHSNMQLYYTHAALYRRWTDGNRRFVEKLKLLSVEQLEHGLTDIWQDLWDQSKLERGGISRYLQYLFLHINSSYIFNRAMFASVPESVCQRIRAQFRLFLADIEDIVITGIKGFSLSEKLSLIDVKEGGQWRGQVELSSDGAVFHHGLELFNVAKQEVTVMTVNGCDGGSLEVELMLPPIDLPSFGFRTDVVCERDGCCQQVACQELEHFRYPHAAKYFFGGEVLQAEGRRFSLPSDFVGSVRVQYQWGEGHGVKGSLGYSLISRLRLGELFRSMTQRRSRLARAFAHIAQNGTYRIQGKHILTRTSDGLRVARFSRSNALGREVLFLTANLLSVWYRRKNAAKVITAVQAWRAFRQRSAHVLTYGVKRSVCLIVSDAMSGANNNGEALYRKLKEHVGVSGRHHRIYFRLSDSCPDYQRLKREGFLMLPLGSKLEQRIFLKAKTLISSYNGFNYLAPLNLSELYWNLQQFDYVYLNHGMLPFDYSHNLRKDLKNIHLYVSGNLPEYHDLISDKYGYRQNEVKLLGFPRFDLLDNSMQENVLLVAPTWRRYLTGLETGKRSYNPLFRDSEFFRFYDRLLNDPELINKLHQTGFKLVFALHPLMKPNQRDFNLTDEAVLFSDASYNNHEWVSKARIAVTDYSSILFDFAYLNKACFYIQFDEEDFYTMHAPAGYFDFDRDGFGQVARDYQATISGLIRLLDNPQMGEEFRARTKRFFPYQDRNNCQRIVDELIRRYPELGQGR